MAANCILLAYLTKFWVGSPKAACQSRRNVPLDLKPCRGVVGPHSYTGHWPNVDGGCQGGYLRALADERSNGISAALLIGARKPTIVQPLAQRAPASKPIISVVPSIAIDSSVQAFPCCCPSTRVLTPIRNRGRVGSNACLQALVQTIVSLLRARTEAQNPTS